MIFLNIVVCSICHYFLCIKIRLYYFIIDYYKNYNSVIIYYYLLIWQNDDIINAFFIVLVRNFDLWKHITELKIFHNFVYFLHSFFYNLLITCYNIILFIFWWTYFTEYIFRQKCIFITPFVVTMKLHPKKFNMYLFNLYMKNTDLPFHNNCTYAA